MKSNRKGAGGEEKERWEGEEKSQVGGEEGNKGEGEVRR